jgi:Zn-dependent protease
MDKFSPEQIAIASILPILFAVTFHEVAHGWVAHLCGDDTAKRQGRLSLNPLNHIDLLGTIILPAVLMLTNAGFIFGWAKPIPVTASRLNNPRKDMILVALAGPGANILMALFWALLARGTGLLEPNQYTDPLALMSSRGIVFNIVLAVFNLLPIPPLDGGRVALELLPYNMAQSYSRIEPYGFFILLGLMFTGIINLFMGLPIILLRSILFAVAGY